MSKSPNKGRVFWGKKNPVTLNLPNGVSVPAKGF